MKHLLFYSFLILFINTVKAQTLLNENFNGSVSPIGWTYQSIASGINTWTFYENYDDIEIYDSNTSPQNEWAITPSVDLSTISNAYLTFKPYIYKQYPNLINTFEFKVVVSVDNGVNWVTIWNFNNMESSDFKNSVFNKTISLPLSNFSGIGMNNVKVGFQYTSAGVSVQNSFVALLGVKISNDCPATSFRKLSSNNLSWFDIEAFSGTYDIEYGLQGFSQGNGTLIENVSESNLDLLNLLSCSNYTFYLRSNCGTSTSDWTTSTFSVPAPVTPLTIPFNENFNNNLCQIGYTKTLGTTTSGIISDNQLKISSDGYGSNVISRGFYLTAGIPIQIQYRFKKATATSLFLSTKIGVNPNPFFQEELNYTNVTSSNLLLRVLNYLPTTTGVHYISFNCALNDIGSGVFIDDFGIGDCATVPIDVPTSTGAIINWIGTGTTYDIEYGLNGFTLGTGTQVLGLTGNSFVISELNPCTDYRYFIRSHCGQDTTSLWKGYPFSTLSANYTAVAPPYIVSFENTNFCILGWKKNIGYFQTFNNALSIQAFTNSNSSEGVSRGVSLTAGTEYFIRYKYNNYLNNASSNANLLVSIGLDESIQNHTVIRDYAPNGIAYTSIFLNESISYIPTISGIYYVGFKTPSNNLNATFLTIDDFSIDDFKVETVSTTSNSATIDWFGTASSYDLEYGPINFAQGTGIFLNSISGNSAVLTELVSCTNYDFYIRPNYGTVNGVWVRGGFATKTSNITPLNIPFEENFNGSLCAIGYSSLGTNVAAEPIFGNNLVLYSNSGAGSRVYSRSFGVLANIPIRILFKVARLNDNTTFGSVGIALTATPNDITVLQNIENPNTGNYTSYVINLTPTATGIYTISFNLNSGIGINFMQGLIFDDFKVDNCSIEIENTLIETTSNSAILTILGSGANYDIEYGLDGFIQGTGTLLTSLAVNNYTLNNLESCTNYAFYYRSNCNIGDSTPWKTGNFSTLNVDYLATNIPYTTDFDGLLCELQWKKLSGNGSIFNVENNSKLVINSGIQANNENGAVISRGLNLIAGQTYTIGYSYANGSTFNTNLKVSIGTTEDIASQTLLKEYPDGITPLNPPNLVFEDETIIFTPTTTGTYYVGFEVPTIPNLNLFIIIDDFFVSSTLSTEDFSKNAISIYPNPTNGLLHISALEAIKQISVYDMLGRLVQTEKSKSQIDIHDLPNAMYLVEITTDKQKITSKILKL